MSDDGYTLVEMLIALAVIGFALGGLASGAHVLGRLDESAHTRRQSVVQATTAVRALQREFEDAGPFLTSTDFTGNRSSLRFDCGSPQWCTMRLNGGRLEGLGAHGDVQAAVPADAEFRYSDGASLAAAWPTAEPGLTLRSVSLVSGRGGFPLGTVRVVVDEPFDCVFDDISGVCETAR